MTQLVVHDTLASVSNLGGRHEVYRRLADTFRLGW